MLSTKYLDTGTMAADTDHTEYIEDMGTTTTDTADLVEHITGITVIEITEDMGTTAAETTDIMATEITETTEEDTIDIMVADRKD